MSHCKHLTKLVTYLWFSFCCLQATTTYAEPLPARHGQQAKQTKQVQIQSIANRAMQAFQIPGVAIAVIEGQTVVHSKGYGIANIHTSQAVDQQTLFKIASNSKAFTSAALALLVQQGKLDWQDKVVQHLPEFRMYDDQVTQQFNIIDLLTHRSGLRIGAGDLMLWPEPTLFSRADVIRNLRYLKPVSEFRKEYAYDNLLYIVAGEVVARVSGMSWEAYVEKNIFKPLGMNRCFAGGVKNEDNQNSVAPHAVVNQQLTLLEKNKINDRTSIMAPAGGIKCSVENLALWVKMLLSNDKSNQLLSQKQKNLMWQPYTKLKLSKRMKEEDKSSFHSYALGWRVSDFFGKTRVSHTGMLGGSMSQIVLFPEQQLGVVVLTNQQSSLGRRAIVRSVIDLYFEDENEARIDWVKRYQKNSSNKKTGSKTNKNANPKALIPVSSKIDNKILNARLGSYSDPWFGNVQLKQTETRIVFSSEKSPRLVGDVYWFSDDRWWVRWHDRSFEADAWIDFKQSDDGRSLLMTMKPISSKTDFSFDFEDLFFHKLTEDNSND